MSNDPKFLVERDELHIVLDLHVDAPGALHVSYAGKELGPSQEYSGFAVGYDREKEEQVRFELRDFQHAGKVWIVSASNIEDEPWLVQRPDPYVFDPDAPGYIEFIADDPIQVDVTVTVTSSTGDTANQDIHIVVKPRKDLPDPVLTTSLPSES